MSEICPSPNSTLNLLDSVKKCKTDIKTHLMMELCYLNFLICLFELFCQTVVTQDRVLEHCYSPFRNAYKSLSRPPFGKSDQSSVLLLPAYRQKLKQEAPALRTIQCWSDQSDAILKDCFDHVDWDMFRAASDDNIEAYSDTVTCFIRKCIQDVVPTKTIRIYPNQKPWINRDVRSALSAWTSAFKSGNTDDRKQASYDLRSYDQGAGGGFQETEQRTHTHHHRLDTCGAGKQL